MFKQCQAKIVGREYSDFFALDYYFMLEVDGVFGRKPLPVSEEVFNEYFVGDTCEVVCQSDDGRFWDVVEIIA